MKASLQANPTFGLTLLAIASSALLSSGEVKALTLVTSRAAIGATDFIDWGQLGTSFTIVNDPIQVTSNLGEVVTVSKGISSPSQIRVQGNSWNGNFANQDNLLFTNTVSNAINPISLFNFSNGILAGGLQIQPSVYGSFTARIQAFDTANSSLGFFDVIGSSTDEGNNSAIFIGVTSDTPIAKLSYSIISPLLANGVSDFSINRFDFKPVPAPLPILGVAAALSYSRQMRKRINANRSQA